VLLRLAEGGPCAGGAVVRCAGFVGSVAGVRSLLGMLEGLLYTSSATNACRFSVNAVWIQRRTGGSASAHSSASTRPAFGQSQQHSTSPQLLSVRDGMWNVPTSKWFYMPWSKDLLEELD
jgi:hypothetical protein